jgi:hypothetical protein
MLAFDDQSLARLCIRATAIPHEARHDWLRSLANRLEAPTANAARARRSRQRVRNGRAIVRFEIDLVAVEEMLKRERLLADDPTREQVEAALTEFVARLAELSAE